MARKDNNRSFKETFDHVEPWTDWTLSFTETFDS